MASHRIRLFAAALMALALAGSSAFAESAPMAPGDMDSFHANLVRVMQGSAGRTQTTWINRKTRNSGVIVAGASYKGPQGQPCKKFVHQFKPSGGAMHDYPGAACRTASGDWQVVE